MSRFICYYNSFIYLFIFLLFSIKKRVVFIFYTKEYLAFPNSFRILLLYKQVPWSCSKQLKHFDN